MTAARCVGTAAAEKIERFFSWLNHYRLLVTRWEHESSVFLGFLKLACAMILLRWS